MRAKQQEKEQRHRVSVVTRGYYSSDSSVREGVGGRGRYTFRPISKVKVYQPVRARREIMSTMNGNIEDMKDMPSQEDYPTTSTRNSPGARLRKQRSRCSESVDADLEFSQIVEQMVAADSAKKKKKSDRSKRRKSIPIPVQKPHGVSSWTPSRISVKEIDTIRETIRQEVLNDLRQERASLLQERRQVETLRLQLKGRRKLMAPPTVRVSPSTQLAKTRSSSRQCLPPSPLAGAGPLKAYTSRSPPREASCEWGLLQDDLMSSLSSIAGCL
ncbi:MAG: uncharacterized protein KVP18_003846 [Porospora cf. gigantea A]|nr:MAG: hypothetical protein KVP18_003846 [Porospora cf. gigantea A]